LSPDQQIYLNTLPGRAGGVKCGNIRQAGDEERNLAETGRRKGKR
jgi:hypothetical protein